MSGSLVSVHRKVTSLSAQRLEVIRRRLSSKIEGLGPECPVVVRQFYKQLQLEIDSRQDVLEPWLDTLPKEQGHLLVDVLEGDLRSFVYALTPDLAMNVVKAVTGHLKP